MENIDELMELKSKKKILKTFMRFKDGRPKTNKELRGESLSPSTLSYHTSQLHRIGLIEREGSVRNANWVLTEKGKRVMNRLRSIPPLTVR